ncbi:isochorismate synthase [Planotetraspora thailandica]|uniref:isochorismate synthase n=1 Tax=Planotetraspora thailandica TaxID=487172 RepID=A0A8J3XZK7_9ACTN|nr:isochorismate synthase [Planotetraspora thailandica]GII58074.1 isochorismate synthase [Planotetraspora thailandica]
MSVALIRPLTVRTVAVSDPADLLARLPGAGPYVWVRHGEGLVGWGVAARTSVPPGPGRFQWAREWLSSVFGDARIDDEVGMPGSGPVAFGSFAFDASSTGSTLVVPQVVLARSGGKAWLTTVGEPSSDTVAPLAAPLGIRYEDGTLTALQWQDRVAKAVRRIRGGDLDKVVLARDLMAVADREIDTRVLLSRLATRYPECYTFSVDGLVGATPELLVRHTGQSIESLVLAGTVARESNPADDAARGAALMASEKDRYEHVCAVVSVKEALAPLCAEMHVPDEPELLMLPNVQHLASRVTGRLSDGASVLDVVAAMHPTAAVGGTPTAKALGVIGELEGMDRGRYAGPVGWIDSRGDGEWGIALRCAEVSGDHARLFAGCGIMGGSDPVAELAEAQAKFRVMQYALEG